MMMEHTYRGAPVVPMVVSVTFPGIDAAAQRMQDTFTRIACDAVRKAGGHPQLVDSAAATLVHSGEVFARASAIVFLGGGDVDAALYGYDGPPPQNEYGVDRRADEYCIDLIREAVDRDLPTLAVCRGSQLLNVAFGGTLVPDIENWSLHRGGAGSPLFIDETVRLDPGSMIAQVLGRTEATVRNGHHQAVAEVATALQATAFAQDGTVEGTQHREASWVLGIQWHPEEPAANPHDRSRTFGALLERA